MILKFYNYSEHWYKSYATVNGQVVICYINKSDIGEQRITVYDLTLDQAVNMQKNASPVTDKDAAWLSATSEQVEYYLDPLNFRSNSDTYLQFLILSHPAGTNATELNNRILYGKGVLAGKGSSYINAAQTYHVNEIYLISHSLLETGNGSSKLATGIKVNGVTVYNVYGVGAYDSNPDYYGAKFAYEQGWTTVEKAIIGGAKFAAENYIHAGQDTLYKMRWNPEAMDTYGYASHQYATDIGWAAKQTTRMAQMLSTLTQFSLLYDVPVYQ
jgi:mannosyl-glycoprotein endo-beta-N-acetylglucosaminidase